MKGTAMRPSTLSLAWLLLQGAALGSAGGGPSLCAGDEILDRWLRAWETGLAIDPRAAGSFIARLEDSFLASRQDPEARAQNRLRALDALALAPLDTDPEFWNRGAQAPAASGADSAPRRSIATRAGRLLDADTGAWEWICSEVLPVAGAHGPARRQAALRWLWERPRPELSTALLVMARRAEDPLRIDALRVLARWAGELGADDSIDVFLVSLLARDEGAAARPHPFSLVQERIRSCSTPLCVRASALLKDRAQAMLLSADWRQASRAVELLRGIDVELRVPLLLDALSAWARRAEAGRGSKRINADLVAELQRISGRNLGSNPGNWITWWVAVRQGRVALPTDPSVVQAADGDEERSHAAFFGLRPATDQVTFIVDHSGSMATGFGTRAVTRYEEAIHQMTRYLQASGPETRFNVILFDSDALRSSVELVEASPENIERARASMLARPPDGGTVLARGVELALCLGADGQIDRTQLVADTIIVLCDGETNEGAAWAHALLRRVQAEAQVRFHCVHIGAQGGAALEALAHDSGGEFLRVSG